MVEDLKYFAKPCKKKKKKTGYMHPELDDNHLTCTLHPIRKAEYKNTLSEIFCCPNVDSIILRCQWNF